MTCSTVCNSLALPSGGRRRRHRVLDARRHISCRASTRRNSTPAPRGAARKCRTALQGGSRALDRHWCAMGGARRSSVSPRTKSRPTAPRRHLRFDRFVRALWRSRTRSPRTSNARMSDGSLTSAAEPVAPRCLCGRIAPRSHRRHVANPPPARRATPAHCYVPPRGRPGRPRSLLLRCSDPRSHRASNRQESVRTCCDGTRLSIFVPRRSRYRRSSRSIGGSRRSRDSILDPSASHVRQLSVGALRKTYRIRHSYDRSPAWTILAAE